MVARSVCARCPAGELHGHGPTPLRSDGQCLHGIREANPWCAQTVVLCTSRADEGIGVNFPTDATSSEQLYEGFLSWLETTAVRGGRGLNGSQSDASPPKSPAEPVPETPQQPLWSQEVQPTLGELAKDSATFAGRDAPPSGLGFNALELPESPPASPRATTERRLPTLQDIVAASPSTSQASTPPQGSRSLEDSQQGSPSAAASGAGLGLEIEDRVDKKVRSATGSCV